MKSKITLITLIIFYSNLLFGQKYYYDKNWKLTSENTNFEFYREVIGNNIIGYYKNGDIQYRGNLSSNYNCEIDCDNYMYGLNTWYGRDGKLSSQKYIDNGNVLWNLTLDKNSSIIINKNSSFVIKDTFNFFQLDYDQKRLFLKSIFETAADASPIYKDLAKKLGSREYSVPEDILLKLNEQVQTIVTNESDKKSLIEIKDKTEKVIYSFVNQFTDKASSSFNNFKIDIYYSGLMKSDKSYMIPVNFSWTGGFSGQYYFINGYFIYNNNNLYHYALTKSSGGFNNEPFAILHLDIASKNFPFSKSFAYNNTNGSKKFKSSESTSITNNEAQELKLWGIGLGFLIAKEGISYLWTNLKEELKNSDSYDTSPSFSSDGSSFTERENKKCFDKAKLDYPKYTIKQIQSDKTLIGTKYIRIDFSSSGQDYSGKLFYDNDRKEYWIDDTGFGGFRKDKNFENLIYPLFVYKKCGTVPR